MSAPGRHFQPLGEEFLNSMLSFFKKRRRQDPIFGSMLYMGDREEYWEAKTIFPPTRSEIEIFVDSSTQDNMEELCRDGLTARDIVNRIITASGKHTSWALTGITELRWLGFQ